MASVRRCSRAPTRRATVPRRLPRPAVRTASATETALVVCTDPRRCVLPFRARTGCSKTRSPAMVRETAPTTGLRAAHRTFAEPLNASRVVRAALNARLAACAPRRCAAGRSPTARRAILQLNAAAGSAWTACAATARALDRVRPAPTPRKEPAAMGRVATSRRGSTPTTAAPVKRRAPAGRTARATETAAVENGRLGLSATRAPAAPTPRIRRSTSRTTRTLATGTGPASTRPASRAGSTPAPERRATSAARRRPSVQSVPATSPPRLARFAACGPGGFAPHRAGV